MNNPKDKAEETNFTDDELQWENKIINVDDLPHLDENGNLKE